jgi:hypothetical protein
VSHVTGLTPAGPVTVAPGETVRFTVDLTTAEDEGYAITVTADDGSTVDVGITVDRPAGALVFDDFETLGAHQALVTSTGGTVSPVAGQPLAFDWTAPA